MLHTSLVRFHLGGSTTRKGSWKEGEHNSTFAEIISEMHATAVRRRKCEIWYFVSHFQHRGRRATFLGEKTHAQPGPDCNSPGNSHPILPRLKIPRFVRIRSEYQPVSAAMASWRPLHLSLLHGPLLQFRQSG